MQTAFLGGRGIFEQDLAPCDIAKKVKKCLKKNQTKVLDCPVSSTRLKTSREFGRCNYELAEL